MIDMYRANPENLGLLLNTGFHGVPNFGQLRPQLLPFMKKFTYFVLNQIGSKIKLAYRQPSNVLINRTAMCSTTNILSIKPVKDEC